MTDTPEADRAARNLAERIHSTYAQQARSALHPQQEQTLLARLAEGARPLIASGSEAELVAAVNAALDAFEQAEPGLDGPRFAGIDRRGGAITIA